MSPTEKSEFVRELLKTYRLAGKDVSQDASLIADWIEEFENNPCQAVIAALRKHRQKSPHPPKPSDLHGYLDGAKADDGRPGADEAWGILSRVISDERETGVLSEEMREAWGICQPVLDLGDEVGARMTFREAYNRLVEQARQRREPARWNVTLGQDVEGRKGAIQHAVRQGRITAQHAQLLLPGASVESLDALAGLLMGPDASEADAKRSESLKRLAQILRNASAAADAKRQQEREDEAAKKAAVRDLLEQHQGGQEAA